MKTVLTKFLAISSIALLMLASCKKDETKVYATSGTPGTLTANATAPIILDKTKYADTTKVVIFNFSKANFGFKAGVTNVLQIDAANDDWKNPTTFTLGPGVLSQGFSTADFNSLLLKLNLPAGLASQVNVRVSNSISTNVTPVYTNILTLTVTPFNLISYVYVAGTYQFHQWTPAVADSLVSPTDNGVYNGYVYFDAGGAFKVTSAPDWNHTNYGDAGGGTISGSGGNINSPGAGLYQVTVDLNKNTIAFTPYIHLWSIIGDGAQGWNAGNDVDMVFNQSANAFQATTPLVSTGSIKFRADHDWGINYGGTAPLAPLVLNGGNLPVPVSGTYLVSLTFGDPNTSPTYTLVKQ
ncbi:MAG TPA: SusE domain-containing protein [Mucilaginibacter sp.]|jgi:hypothetical protein|nr:SusE domain-containing protein [Mucilaginibacter sp.]